MKFMLLTPGTGYFFCGSCLRDSALAGALRRAGHDATVVPLYLPHVLEDEAAPADPTPPVQMGGINMYLQQKVRGASLLPRFIARLLDRPGLLRRASRWGNMTDAPDLGAMTVSMLRGENGRQRHEVEKLVGWVAGEDRPDVIVISNAMLCGVVRRLKAELGVPIVVTLQGEAPFLDTLSAPFSAEAWRELAAQAEAVDAFVPVSEWYGDLMVERLRLDRARVRVIHNGVDLSGFADDPPRLSERQPPTVGYLARMCRDKGLHVLVDAFIRLAERADLPADLRLRVVGAQLNEDAPFVEELRQRLAGAGLLERVEFFANVERADKIRHLQSFSVLSVPATYGESFGLYVLEAMAAGVPVVQPRHAAFPELLAATGGGELCAADDPAALAEGLAQLLLDPVRAQALADAGRAAVRERFVADRMAAEFVDLCKILPLDLDLIAPNLPPESMPDDEDGRTANVWMIYALTTVVCWGIYGIFLHTGRMGFQDPANGLYKAFLWVGVAYFLIAVLAPIGLLVANGADWHMPSKGLWWSLLAGSVGAIGALGVLLAFGAKGHPAVVMSIIFAGAPIVNAIVAFAIHPPANGFGSLRWQFIAGILLAAIGGMMVTLYKPPPGGAKGPAKPPVVKPADK